MSGTPSFVLDLTPAQAGLLAALRRRRDRGEAAPTYRELCAEFGWASTGTARDHLQVLARKGYVVLGGGKARQVRLPENPPLVRRVPLLGSVVAGRPQTAEEREDGAVSVAADWLDSGPHFALRVEGDSMEGAAIVDGDVVLVREQRTGCDGDIVVATLDGETTLKRLRIRDDGIWLEPENQKYKPIRADAPLIQGVVVALVRGVSAQLARGTGGTGADNGRHLKTRSGRTKRSQDE